MTKGMYYNTLKEYSTKNHFTFNTNNNITGNQKDGAIEKERNKQTNKQIIIIIMKREQLKETR